MSIDIQALYDALAKVIEERENASITIKVERKETGNEEDSGS